MRVQAVIRMLRNSVATWRRSLALDQLRGRAVALARGLHRRVLDPLYAVYARRLWGQVRRGAVPGHLAIILDGNRRFTRRSALGSMGEGYAAGASRVFDVIRWSERAGVRVITLWAVSVDNLRRPPEQVASLFGAVEGAVHDLIRMAKLSDWRLRGIGRRELLPPSLIELLERADAETKGNQALVVQLAIGYGGREEIVDALRHWADTDGIRGRPIEEAVERLTPERLGAYLYGGDLPEPDLILRTSGEVRLSGFLLWQSVHSEFYFTDVLWPEFREIDFLRALRSFSGRHRRFGR
jgi:short-chain Z-isoprenyl diphosphate synthase